MKKEVERITLGKTSAGPRLKWMLGTRCVAYPMAGELRVPTPNGFVYASYGDTIILYDDDTLEVKSGYTNDPE